MKRSSLVLIGIIMVLLVGGLVAWQLLKPKADVSLVASPSVAQFVVDGSKKVHPGNFYLPVGSHKVQASMEGFASKTVSFDVRTTGITKVTVVLIPNSSVGTDWLTKHPEESSIREGIGDQTYDKQNEQATTQTPLIKELPYIGAGFEFRVDYGSAQAGSTKPTIIITGATPAAQQDAVTWITGQGYDTSTLNIQYVTAQP